jgi:hypothetical protein
MLKLNNIYKPFERGFIVFRTSKETAERIVTSSNGIYFDSWEKTYFGAYQIWADRKLSYASYQNDKYGVAILGLCINPFTGLATNREIAQTLTDALGEDIRDFYDCVDQLSGSFIVLYRENDKLNLLQDCAATKPIYFASGHNFGTVISSHARIVSQIFDMQRDSRVELVFGNDVYRNDPSRYLPGDITPYAGLKTLTANTCLILKTGGGCDVQRIFPRGPLINRTVNDALIEEVVEIFKSQAEILSKTGRPLVVAATAGRDSRLSVAAFAKSSNTELFAFHYPNTGHLTDDVKIAMLLSEIINVKLNIYNLSEYGDEKFNNVFKLSNPVGIWPAATLCYLNEFPVNAIHIRSTVSEIGRMFYRSRTENHVSPDALAKTYTNTEFGKSDLVAQAMTAFIKQSHFKNENFFNYNFYDMFYWEHRNSKWQNILCQEAEMATDVFIPFNNRKLIKLFLAAPESDRKVAKLHVEATNELCPKFSEVPYIS